MGTHAGFFSLDNEGKNQYNEGKTRETLIRNIKGTETMLDVIILLSGLIIPVLIMVTIAGAIGWLMNKLEGAARVRKAARGEHIDLY